MTKLLKDFCVAALREAGYEKAARWLNDAPKQAVEKVAKIVMLMRPLASREKSMKKPLRN